MNRREEDSLAFILARVDQSVFDFFEEAVGNVLFRSSWNIVDKDPWVFALFFNELGDLVDDVRRFALDDDSWVGDVDVAAEEGLSNIPSSLPIPINRSPIWLTPQGVQDIGLPLLPSDFSIACTMRFKCSFSWFKREISDEITIFLAVLNGVFPAARLLEVESVSEPSLDPCESLTGRELEAPLEVGSSSLSDFLSDDILSFVVVQGLDASFVLCV